MHFTCTYMDMSVGANASYTIELAILKLILQFVSAKPGKRGCSIKRGQGRQGERGGLKTYINVWISL